MKLSRAQKKAEMEKAAEEMIEALLDWDEENQAPNLHAVEGELLRLQKQMGRELAAQMLENQEAAEPIENPSCPGCPSCPSCGETMRYKGKKPTTVESRLSELTVKRGCYYCAHCKCGLFPLDEQMELRGRDWSEGLEREAVWLSGAVSSYELVGEILMRVGQVEMSPSGIWRVAQADGERFRALEEQERHRANCLPERWEPPAEQR